MKVYVVTIENDVYGVYTTEERAHAVIAQYRQAVLGTDRHTWARTAAIELDAPFENESMENQK